MSALNIVENLKVVDGRIFTNSLFIAEVFDKRHDNILKSINRLTNDEFKNQNFKCDTYFDKKGEQRRMFNLTRDGFSLLVMGFTGVKAYQWKIEFIKAFNAMEKRLKELETMKQNKKAFYQKLGFKSQLSQQKEHYENKIKALRYDLEHAGFYPKRKLSADEILKLKILLAKEYEMICFQKWQYLLFAEKISKQNYAFEKQNNFKLYKELKEGFNAKLNYYQRRDDGSS